MRPLRYSINVTLDGCCDHRAIPADEDLHRHAAENIARADALLLGRVTYQMMEAAWRRQATGAWPDWMEPWMEPFARTMDAAKKYVVSSTLDRVDWNSELVRGDLANAVQQLKRETGKGLFTGGVTLPMALAELGLIDEYEFVVHPRLAGHGPTLFAGLSRFVDLELVSRQELGSGAVAMRYRPRGRSNNMKFICLGHYDPSMLAALPEEKLTSLREECFAYDDELRRGGHFAGGEALQPPNAGVTLRYREGKVDVTDGPYVETKEVLGGILILEARDLNHAIALMSKHPGVSLGPFEIRPADEEMNEIMAARDAAFRAKEAARG